MPKPKAWLAWSSGKDSAWALHAVQETGNLEIVGILTTITEPFERVTMHGVRTELLEAQIQAVGLPVHRVLIPSRCPHDVYTDAMRQVLDEARSEGITHMIFGDIFLSDVRAYREEQLAEAGFTAYFPLWSRDTLELAREMMAAGLRANITCLDPRKVSRDLAGAPFDEAFLAQLPEGADPCGENGEFHTFVSNLPSIFNKPVEVRAGEIVERGGFIFADLLLSDAPLIS